MTHGNTKLKFIQFLIFYCLSSQNSQQMLKMSSTSMYWHTWSWIVADSQRSWGDWKLFERHYNCVGEVYPTDKNLKGSSSAIVALTRKFSVCGSIWIWTFSLFQCAEHSLEVLSKYFKYILYLRGLRNLWIWPCFSFPRHKVSLKTQIWFPV